MLLMGGMTTYFLRRLLLVPVTFLAITLLVYTVLRLVPGGPIEQAEARMRLGQMGEAGASGGGGADDAADLQMDEQAIAELQAYYALDRPIVIGYLQWLGAWPREVRHRVPRVPVGENAETIARLTRLEEDVTAANEALETFAEARGLVRHAGRLFEAAPDDAVPEKIRENAPQVAARTVGERPELARLLEPHGLDWADGRFLRPANDGADLVAALAEARRARAQAEEETGYHLVAPNRLLQNAFRPLRRLNELRKEVRERLAEHLAERDLLEFRGRLFAPIPEEEARRLSVHEDAEELARSGFEDRDDLMELLWEHDLTWRGGTYYRRLDPGSVPEAYLETARALVAASIVAGRKLEEIEEEHGFAVTEDGLIDEVGSAFSGILQLDFGRSYTHSEPVLGLIGSRMEISIQFGLIGYFLTWLVCVPLGVLKAIKHRTGFDTGSSVAVFLGYSIPNFVLCLILLSTIAGGWLPLGGYKPENIEDLGWWESVIGRIRHMIIPVAGYMIGGFASMTILMKNSLLENLGADYVRTAFAKGLSEKRVIFVHALRNSLIPVTAGIGHALGLLFAGSFLIEKTCNIPGMGLLGYQAILERDFPITLGLLVFLVLIRLFGNILSDVIWALIDPRIRFGR